MDYLDDDADDAAIEAAAAAASRKRARSAEQGSAGGRNDDGDDGSAPGEAGVGDGPVQVRMYRAGDRGQSSSSCLCLCRSRGREATLRAAPRPPHALIIKKTKKTDPLSQPFTGSSAPAALRAIAAASPALTGPDWGWIAASDPLSWKGVTSADGATVAELNLADAAAVSFPPRALAALAAPALTSLRVSCCGLTPDNSAGLTGDLAACTALTSLALDGNAFPALPASIAALPSLGALYAGMNPMRSLGSAFDGMASKMHTLDVAGCQLASLPDALGRLRALTALVANNNALTSIPDGIGALTALQRLSLHCNELTALPQSITACSALAFCTLNCNALTALPAGMDALPLSRLSLHFNALTMLPPSIGSAIEALSAFNNQLTDLPGDLVASFPSIVRLSLYNNALASIPPQIGLCTSLVELWLSDNALSSLPPEIGACTALQRCWLTGNRLVSLPDELGACGALQELYLDRNPLLKSVPASLTACARLRRIFCDPGLDLVPALSALAERGGAGEEKAKA